MSTAATPLSITPSGMAWFLVYSKPRQEAVALHNLERQGYSCYLPMYTTEKLVHRIKTVVQEPMFARYLFVQLDTTGQGQSWVPIRSTTGVSTLVRFGQQPVKVDAQLIAALRTREAIQKKNPKLLFVPGENVVVMEGAFAGLQAIYQMSDSQGRAMVLLSLLNKPAPMKVEFTALRKLG